MNYQPQNNQPQYNDPHYSDPQYNQAYNQYNQAPQQPQPYSQPSAAYQAPQGNYGYPQPVVYGPPKPGTNVMAIISLVTAVLGVGVASIITGHIALGQIKKTGEDGRMLAIIGLVIGYLSLVGILLAIIVWVIMMAIAVNLGGTSGALPLAF